MSGFPLGKSTSSQPLESALIISIPTGGWIDRPLFFQVDAVWPFEEPNKCYEQELSPELVKN
jgi:hypothetical protein